MKNILKLLMAASFLFLTQIVSGQQESRPAKPAEPVEVHVEIPEIDFHEFRMMNAADEKELLKNLAEELKRELKTIKEVDKEKYFDFLRESQYKNMRIPFISKREKVLHAREKKIFEAEVKAEALAAKYEKTKNQSQRNKIKEQLRSALNNLFEVKEKRREDEVKELEEELKELRKSLAVRQKNKKNIIERRIQDLLDEDQYLDWD